ncbi:uncharacterized protein LOC107268968 [Cephus cinctus]|uniref:Uncharacterized protein LOC107268968 n=1 Tax=Cephus cinctus TaxID=211228 RepID=A0AAJ7BZ01_CEPCN|nr:uncharacterized protein LOC107268968 [Cephus cinctus]
MVLSFTEWFLMSVLIIILNVLEIYSHGMLMVPVNRGSAWRYGYNTPINYDDNANFCGGFAVQWIANNGNCGACGDNYSIQPPRPNENKGTYGRGVIVATYNSGAAIDVSVKITANHRGYFVFSICSLSSSDDIDTEECFEKYPLKLADGTDRYTLRSSATGFYNTTVILPTYLTCDHCVLRWHYYTANNWGICSNGTGALGCGRQETFRTCSDIAIISPSK